MKSLTVKKVFTHKTRLSSFTYQKKLLRDRPIAGGQVKRKLTKSVAVDLMENLMKEEKTTQSKPERLVQQPSATYWEELQDIFFEKKFKRARNASQESFMENEDECTINLTKMYKENSGELSSPTPSDPLHDSSDLINDII